MGPTEMAYRKTSVGGASGFGLLIALYDTLAGDLKRAADAERADDLDKRTRELHHALLVVGYLEDWVSKGTGGDLADRLTAFYRTLRRKVIEAQVKRSAAMLEQQMDEVLKIRQIWQGFEQRGAEPTRDARSWTQAPAYPGAESIEYEETESRWCA